MTLDPQVLGPPPGPTREVLGVPVTEGKVPPRWEGALQTEFVVADPDRLLVWHQDAAIYVAGGSEVVVETRSGQHRLDYDYLVYAFASRALLLQRRRFSLHATMVVSPEGTGVAITGDSMAGKSTTTMELMRRGWRYACDDVLEVELRDGVPVAVPFERPIHLSDDAARLLGADPDVGRSLPVRGKRAFSLAGDLTPRPLSGIVRLRVGESDEIGVTPLTPLAALPVLAVLSDRFEVCQHPDLRADYLSWTAAVSSGVPVCDVSRPALRSSVTDVSDAVAAWAGQLQVGRARAASES